MRIVFFILAVIGILLLVILALAALCLFYPVSYRIKGEAEEELSLYGRFWWLFGLLWFEFDVRDFKPGMRFGIFWWSRSFGGEDAGEKEPPAAFTQEAPAKPDADKPKQSGKTAASKESRARKAGLPAEGSSVKTDTFVSEEGTIEEAGLAETKQAAAGKNGTGKKRKAQKKRNHARARAKPEKKMKSPGALKAGLSELRKELSDGKNRMAVQHFWREATYIFTHLKPKYANGAVSFAAGDPEWTGLLTGALSLLPVMYQYEVCICPDFISDDPYIRGTAAFGGRMSLYHMLLCLIRIIRDENAMKFIQKFR